MDSHCRVSFCVILGGPLDVGGGSVRPRYSRTPFFVCCDPRYRACGAARKLLVAIPLLLFAVRTVSVTRHFKQAQPALAALARSFDAVPHGALVLPIVEGDEDPIERPFTHFWAYGVIRRGWFSPYLMDAPGETPMRIIYESYTPDGFWNLGYDQAPDWQKVRNEYEYVWAYDVPRFSSQLAGIGERIYSSGALEVYRIRKSAGTNESPDSIPVHK